MDSVTMPQGDVVYSRRLASKADKLAWELSRKSFRTPQESEDMLSAAYASAYLWSTVGNERSSAFCNLLLGQVHAQLGSSESAMRYATSAHDYFSGNTDTLWELAIANVVLANAAFQAANYDLYEAAYAAAEALIRTASPGENMEMVRAAMQSIPAKTTRLNGGNKATSWPGHRIQQSYYPRRQSPQVW